jgi:hypothetical protein
LARLRGGNVHADESKTRRVVHPHCRARSSTCPSWSACQLADRSAPGDA